MASSEKQDEEFNFYLKFAKPLVLNLADTNDRIKAASWIRKLRFDTGNPALRGDYLKLLLFVLQRRKLIGPFATIPDDKPLEQFPDEINLQDVAKNFMEVDKRVLKETLEKGGFGEWPSYTVACSADLTEYAASQDIPNFGTQVYFAISRDPLQAWDHCERAMFSIGENVDLTKPDATLSPLPSPNISCFVSAEQAAQATAAKRGAKDAMGDGLDASPESKQKSPDADPFGVDAQISPTWGSNLVKVNEAPSPPAIDEEEDMDLDFDVSDRDILDFDESMSLIGDSDLDESFYLQGDALKSPARSGRAASPAPSLPYATPRLPGPQLPSPAPSLPYGTPPPKSPRFSPDVADERDMLDYSGDSFNLTGDTDFFDAAADFRSQSPAPSLPYATPRLPGPQLPSPAPSLPYKTPPQRRPSPDAVPCGGSTQTATSPGSPQGEPCSSGSREPTSKKSSSKKTPEYERILRDLEDQLNAATPPGVAGPSSPSQKIARTMKGVLRDVDTDKPSLGILKEATEELDTSGGQLGGDSFIAPEKKGFGWLEDIGQGPGLSTDEEQDSALWESFGWWTDDPEEIFTYLPPTPRTREPSDPYAADRERWADVPPTPPLFSRDPAIRDGPGGQRIYGIDEFGMESFEEPAWEPAEQFFKYRNEMSPYRDPRDVDRRAMHPSQYPAPCSELNRRLDDIVPSEGESSFDDEPPNMMDVSFTEKDFVPMTRAEAHVEAFYHGAMPPINLEHEIDYDEAMHDVGFLASTPEKHIMQQASVFTPPKYQPPNINAEELDESITKYIDDEMQIITSEIPVTTPEISASPKRQQRLLLDDTLPAAIDDELNENIRIPRSPELKTPTKYKSSPHEIDWETNIGEAKLVSPLRKPGYTAQEDDVRTKENAKRKAEIAAEYGQQFYELPFESPSPERPPHPFDERIPDHLTRALSPDVLPPANWAWESPPETVTTRHPSPVIRTPTAVSPAKQIQEGMVIESPPDEFYSPTSPSAAVSALQGSPRGFKTPSPVRSPGGRPCWDRVIDSDDIERQQMYPTDYDDLEEESADLYHSPRQSIEERIAALEEALFADLPSKKPPSRIDDEEETDFQRQLWRDSIDLHKKFDYPKKRFIVQPKGGKQYVVKKSQKPKLETIKSSPPCTPCSSPPKIPSSPKPLSQEDAVREGQRKLLNILLPEESFQEAQKRFLHLMFPEQLKIPSAAPASRTTTRIEFQREEQIPPISPVRQPQLQPFDLEAAMKKYSATEPPGGWVWDTPPKLHSEKRSPAKIITPTGISPPTHIPEDITIFYESPPKDVCSPCSPSGAVESLRYTPPPGFGEEPRITPMESPGGRPMQKFDTVQDEIDMAHIFPDEYDFDTFSLEDAPEFYQSPPPPDTPENIRQHRRRDYVASPTTPEEERKAWQQNILDFETYPLRKKMTRASRRPQLSPVDERPATQLSGISRPAKAKQSRLVRPAGIPCPGAAKSKLSGLAKPSKVSGLPSSGGAKSKISGLAKPSKVSGIPCPGGAKSKKSAIGRPTKVSGIPCPGAAKRKSSESDRSSHSSIASCPGSGKVKSTGSAQSSKSSIASCPGVAKGKSIGSAKGKSIGSAKGKSTGSAQSSQSSIGSCPGSTKGKSIGSARSSQSSIASCPGSGKGKSTGSSRSSQSSIASCPGAKGKPSKLVKQSKASGIRAPQGAKTKPSGLVQPAKTSKITCPGAKRLKQPTQPAQEDRPRSPQPLEKLDAQGQVCSPCPSEKSSKKNAEDEERIARRGRGIRRIREQFAGPARPSSPPEGGYHPFDEPVPQDGLPRPQHPSGSWGWNTPPKLQTEMRSPRVIRTPTGLSPPKEFDDVSLYYESPPPTSPSTAVSSLQYTPPPGFGQPSSPIRTPCGSPMFSGWENEETQVDLNRAQLYNTFGEIGAEEEPYFPPRPPRIMSPEQQQLRLELDLRINQSQVDTRISTQEGNQFFSPSHTSRQSPSPSRRRSPSPEMSPGYSKQSPKQDIKSPGGSSLVPVFSNIQDDIDIAEAFPAEYDNVGEEEFPRYESPPKTPPHVRERRRRMKRLGLLPTSPRAKARQELIDLEREAFHGPRPPPPQPCQPCGSGTPPTPEYKRKIWQQELMLRDPLQLQKKSWIVKPKPGKAYKVDRKSKAPKLPPVKEKFFEYASPVRSPTAIQQHMTPPRVPPENWTWQTPSPKSISNAYKHLVSEGQIPFFDLPATTRTSPGLLTESPPHDICSPETPCPSTCSASPPMEEFGYDFDIPDIMVSPPQSPLSHQSPLRSPRGRPILPEWVSEPADDIDIAEAFPAEYDNVGEEEFPRYESPPKTPPHVRERHRRMKRLGLLPTSPRAKARQELIDLEREAFHGPRPPPPQPCQPCGSGTPPTPEYKRKIWQQELMLRDPLQLQKKSWIVKPKPGKAYKVDRKSKAPKLPPVKEKFFEYASPVRSPTAIHQHMTPPGVPPENWTWQTPSPKSISNAYQHRVNEGQIPFFDIPATTRTSPELLTESPPHDICSPESPCPTTCSASSPIQEFGYDFDIPDVMVSPPQSPLSHQSPLRSPGGRPILPEWVSEPADVIDIAQFASDQYNDMFNDQMPPEEFAMQLPPTPPPLPAPPQPYHHQVYLDPRNRPKPDYRMFDTDTEGPYPPCSPSPKGKRTPIRQKLVHRTPPSAGLPYEPQIEARRYEQSRPEPEPPVYYDTPGIRQPSRRINKPLNRGKPRRRIDFDDNEYEEERFQEAVGTCPAILPDIQITSPPRDLEMMQDIPDYEPQDFNLYEPDEDYDVRLPFEGQPHILDTGFMQEIDEIQEDERDFKWMGCGSLCPGDRRK